MSPFNDVRIRNGVFVCNAVEIKLFGCDTAKGRDMIARTNMNKLPDTE